MGANTQGLSLYYFQTCPFCRKVLAAMDELKLELRDTRANSNFRAEQIAGSGKAQVPCLRIEQDNDIRWLYESSDIIAYLKTL